MMNCAEPDIKVYAGPSSQDLARRIVKYLRMDLSSVDVVKFADGETFIKTNESVRGSRVFVVQSTSKPVNENIMDLLIFIDSLKRASAEEIIVVIPYYGYARQDRKAAPRVPITAKLVADILETAGITRVVTIDLHAAQIQGFFNIPADNLFGSILFKNYIKSKNLKNPIIASPDIGGVTRARSYADKLGYDLVIVDKKREKANVSEVMNIIGDVKGMDVILVDDMVDTAGTLVKAAEALKKKGANSVMACCTHGVLSGPAYERIEKGELDELVISDTIPTRKNAKKITVLTASTMIGEAIRRIHNNESVNSIFTA